MHADGATFLIGALAIAAALDSPIQIGYLPHFGKRRMGMLRIWVSLAGLMIFGLTGARAQSEALFDPNTRHSVNPEPDRITEPPPPAEIVPIHPWSIDLLIGTETGVRFKRFFNNEKGYGWMGELYLGLDYVFFPAAGAGLRYGIAPWMGRFNVVSVSPGVNIQALANPFANSGGWFGGGPSGFGLLIADFDVSWRHVYTDSFSGELGVKLGVGATLGNVQRGVLPIVSFYAGFRF